MLACAATSTAPKPATTSGKPANHDDRGLLIWAVRLRTGG
jgi:hypothetical protein